MTPAPSGFRFRDALRDLVRAPGAASIVMVAVLALAFAPLGYDALVGARMIATAPDGRTAFKAYQTWCVIAIALAALGTRCAAALAASAMVERFDRPLGVGEAAARALAHGLPAVVAALFAFALVSLGLIAAVIGALPLAALAYVAGPAAAVERLGPAAAVRRSAVLTRGARVRLGAWIAALLAIQIAPLVIARAVVLKGAKPPVAPVLHAMQLHAWILIATAVIAAPVQVLVYRRLRAAEPASAPAS